MYKSSIFRLVSTSRFHKFCGSVFLFVCVSVYSPFWFGISPILSVSLRLENLYRDSSKHVVHILTIWLQPISKDVLLASFKDALETPRRQNTSKEARYFKICKIRLVYHSNFVSKQMTPVMKQACILDSLEDTLETPRIWDTLKKLTPCSIM